MAEQPERLHLNVQFRTIPETLESEFQKDFPRFVDGLAKSDPGGLVVPALFVQYVEEIHNFQPRVDDTWVVTFPKCGTTWMQEMVWLIVNDCDFERAKEKLNLRSPFLELPFLRKTSVLQDDLTEIMMRKSIERPFEHFNQMPSPRVIKSHLPLNMLHPKLLDTCKVVYVARNPKDVIVSFFYHYRLVKYNDYSGDLENFANYFLKGQVLFGSFFDHVLDAWAKRHHPNLLFVFYEDLKKDLRGQVKKVADFLQKPLTEVQLTKLTEHLSFESFSRNEAVNAEDDKAEGLLNADGNFIRKGQIGDWKNHFSAELNERIDRWIEANLQGSDLKFITELEKED